MLARRSPGSLDRLGQRLSDFDLTRRLEGRLGDLTRRLEGRLGRFEAEAGGDLRQALRLRGPRARVAGEDRPGGRRQERREHALDVLVLEDRDDEGSFTAPEGLLQGPAEDPRRLGVVGAVQHHHRSPGDDLHPPRGGDRRQTGLHGPGVQRAADQLLARREGERGVASLVVAQQGEKHLLVDAARRPLNRNKASAQGQFVGPEVEVPVHDGKGGPHVGGCRRQELPDVGVLDGRDDAGPRLDDAHLLPGVVERGRAEHGRVVDGDMRQHGDAARDDVRGIPGAAHARLVDARVDAVHRHPFERHHRGELEVGHDLARLALDELDEGQEVLDQGGELFGGDGLEQDAGIPARLGNRPGEEVPLPDALQVRGGVDAGRQSVGGKDRADDAGGRRLAVGPGDLQGGVGRLRVVEQLDERLDAGEIGQDRLPPCLDERPGLPVRERRGGNAGDLQRANR